MNPFDWFNGLRALIEGRYDDAFAQLAVMLTTTAVPPLAIFRLEWFSTQLGATVGLAMALYVPITAIVGLVMMIKVPAARQTPMTGRLFTSVWMLMAFIVAFYPLIDLVLAIVAGIRDGLIIFVTGIPTPDLGVGFKIITSALPTDIGLQLGAKMLFVILTAVLMFEVMALMIATPFIILFYPIAIMLRVFGGWLDRLFHALTTGLVLGIFSAPLMGVLMLLPVGVAKIPGIGTTIWAQFVAGTFALGLAIYLPFMIRKWAKPRLSEMFGRIEAFGRVDATIRGTVTTRSVPPPGRAGSSGGSNQQSPVGAFAKSMAIGTAAVGLSSKNADEFRKKVRHVAADAAAAGLAASGMAGPAALIQAADSSMKVREENEKKKQHIQEVAEATANAMAANQTPPVPGGSYAPPPPNVPPPPPPPPPTTP